MDIVVNELRLSYLTVNLHEPEVRYDICNIILLNSYFLYSWNFHIKSVRKKLPHTDYKICKNFVLLGKLIIFTKILEKKMPCVKDIHLMSFFNFMDIVKAFQGLFQWNRCLQNESSLPLNQNALFFRLTY